MMKVGDTLMLRAFDTLKVATDKENDRILNATMEIDKKQVHAGHLVFDWGGRRFPTLHFSVDNAVNEQPGNLSFNFEVKFQEGPVIERKKQLKPSRGSYKSEEEEVVRRGPPSVELKVADMKADPKLYQGESIRRIRFENLGSLTSNLERAINENPQAKDWVIKNMEPEILH